MTKPPIKERRQSSRLPGRKEAIVIHPNGIDNIGDISSGGLSFHCSQEDFFPEQWPVDIVFAGTPLYITSLAVRLVSERPDNVLNFLTTPTKKVGVAFEDLDNRTGDLLGRLFYYLQHPPTH